MPVGDLNLYLESSKGVGIPLTISSADKYKWPHSKKKPPYWGINFVLLGL